MPRVSRSGFIPKITSDAVEKEYTTFVKGINSYATNDNVADNQLVFAQDARITSLGSYKTRQGCNFYSVPAGETIDLNRTSTTGAANQSFNNINWLASKYVAAASGQLTKIDLNLKNDASASGTIIIKLFTNNAGVPGTELAQSDIVNADLSSTYAYISAKFIQAPTIVSGTTYWIVVYVQTDATGSYKWSSTTSVTTGLTSSNSGINWSAASFGFNAKTYLSTSNGTIGLFRAYKSDGTVKTLIAYGTHVDSINDLTGALTTVKSSLSSSATKYRFAIANDTVYYVNGIDAPRKWDFTTESAVGGSPAISSNIIQHKGLMFYNSAADPNKWFFSNFAAYETFTSTDFFYVPSPKTGDPSTAAQELNDALIIFTRFSKYILYGVDNATFNLTLSPGKKGTYSQETTASDGNFLYFLSDDGVYSFDGTQDKLLSVSNYEDIKNLPNKDDACLVVNNGRLYVYYTPSGQSANSACWVYNINLECWESQDTNTYVSRALTMAQDNHELLVGSSIVAAAYKQELASNDYTNLGTALQFEVRPKYYNFDKPSKLKELREWRPRFIAQTASYSVDCLYAVDLRDSPQSLSEGSVPMQGSGSTWGSGITWGDFTYGSSAFIEPSLSIPGEYQYIQPRYKHYATRQPIEFFGHFLRSQIRRLH
jgi:hypothetical protein